MIFSLKKSTTKFFKSHTNKNSFLKIPIHYREMSILSKYKFYRLKNKQIKTEKTIENKEIDPITEQNQDVVDEIDKELENINLSIDSVINEAKKKQRIIPDKLISAPEEIRNFNYKVAKQPKNPMSLTVSLVGLPNSGKSTLLNSILNSKIAAVSPKQQTTRENILGILTEDNKQIEFNDTPGVIPKEKAKK